MDMTGHHRRALQEDGSTWLSRAKSEGEQCSWDGLNKRFEAMAEACCPRGTGTQTCDAGGVPRECTPSCAVEIHAFSTQCQPFVRFYSDVGRQVMNLEDRCLDSVEVSDMISAMASATCERTATRIPALRALRAWIDFGFALLFAAVLRFG